MRPVRILIVAVALIAVAVAGWALAGGDYGVSYGRSAAAPSVTAAPPQGDPQAAPTGTGTGDLAVSLGVDRNGRDGYTARWRYDDQPLLAHLTVRATGPGGTTDKVVGIYHPDPTEQP